MGLKDHYKFKIDWIDFPNTFRKVAGVYMIGDCVYIGASIHIRSRIIHHLNSCKRKDHNDKTLQNYYDYCIENNLNIEVKRIDENPLNEVNYKTTKNSKEKFYHQNISKRVYNKI